MPDNTRKPVPRSHPDAQALLGRVMQNHGEKGGDANLIEQGRRLAESAIREDARRRRQIEPLKRLLEPTGEVVLRDNIDNVAMVEAVRVPPSWPLEALPRPAPPQERPRPWWRRWPWRW